MSGQNQRDCKHGNQSRACEICERDATIADLRGELAKERIKSNNAYVKEQNAIARLAAAEQHAHVWKHAAKDNRARLMEVSAVCQALGKTSENQIRLKQQAERERDVARESRKRLIALNKSGFWGRIAARAITARNKAERERDAMRAVVDAARKLLGALGNTQITDSVVDAACDYLRDALTAIDAARKG